MLLRYRLVYFDLHSRVSSNVNCRPVLSFISWLVIVDMEASVTATVTVL